MREIINSIMFVLSARCFDTSERIEIPITKIKHLFEKARFEEALKNIEELEQSKKFDSLSPAE